VNIVKKRQQQKQQQRHNANDGSVRNRRLLPKITTVVTSDVNQKVKNQKVPSTRTPKEKVQVP
jgi:hypothetical protein